jgi:hypothetical protein
MPIGFNSQAVNQFFINFNHVASLGAGRNFAVIEDSTTWLSQRLFAEADDLEGTREITKNGRFPQSLEIESKIIVIAAQFREGALDLPARLETQWGFSPSLGVYLNDFVNQRVAFQEDTRLLFDQPIDPCLRIGPFQSGYSRQRVDDVSDRPELNDENSLHSLLFRIF